MCSRISSACLKQLFGTLGMEKLEEINWTSPAVFVLGHAAFLRLWKRDYFMLIFLSGIERIPRDLYESARLDGADKLDAVLADHLSPDPECIPYLRDPVDNHQRKLFSFGRKCSPPGRMWRR